MTDDFQFEPSQRELIRDLAKHLRNVGYIWACVAILGMCLDFFDVLAYLAKVHPINVLDIFKKPMEDRQFFDLMKSLLKDPLYIVVGIFAVRASSFLSRIAEQQGEDIENLLLGLGQLRNSLFTLYLFAIIFVILLWIRIIFFPNPSQFIG
jgi:hypothetical protein